MIPTAAEIQAENGTAGFSNARKRPLKETLIVSCVATVLLVGVWFYYFSGFDQPVDAIPISSALVTQSSTHTLPAVDKTDWLSTALPHDWHHSGIDGMYAWYSVDLVLHVPENQLWGVYLPRVTSNVRAFLNGEIIGQGGRLEGPTARNWNRPLYFAIPNGVLLSGKNNLSLQVIASPGSPGYLGQFYIGSDESLRMAYQRAHRIRVRSVVTATTGLLVGSLLTLGFWIGRRQDALSFWFANMCFVWALHNFNLLVVEIPLSVRLWEVFRHLTMGWFVVLLIFAMHRLLGEKPAFAEKSLCAVTFVGSLALVGLTDLEVFFFYANWIWATGVLLLGVYPAVRVTYAWFRDWNIEYLIAMFSGVPILLAGAHDWMRLNGLVSREYGLFIQIGAPIMLLGFTVILMVRYARALNESEFLNRTLESRVDEIRIRLKENYSQLRSLEENQLLSQERERIMRDMHDGVGGQLVSALSLTDNDQYNRRELRELLKHALMDLRLMIDSLDQNEGDLVSVLGTLRSRMQTTLEISGIEVIWKVKDLEPMPDLGSGKILHILRIVQEAITNVIKHSNASRVCLRTYATETQNLIEIEDDGCGFDQSTHAGHGLRNMEYRAEQAGIQLLVMCRSGTLVRLAITRHDLPTRRRHEKTET